MGSYLTREFITLKSRFPFYFIFFYKQSFYFMYQSPFWEEAYQKVYVVGVKMSLPELPFF